MQRTAALLQAFSTRKWDGFKARFYTFAGCSTTTNFPTEPGTCYAVTAQDLETIYNLNPLYTAGYSGRGQTIALVEDTDTFNGTGDWNYYRKVFGLARPYPYGNYAQLHPGSCTDPGVTADDIEAALDVEVASAVAPNANIELISCAGGTFTFGGQVALQNLINESGTPPGGVGVVSVSYGVCEAANGTGGNAAFLNTYQQAASEGISVFASSGDELATACSRDFSVGDEYAVTSVGVTGWGETPYNVSVGGTDFEDVYNSKSGDGNPVTPLSTYWNSTNNGSYESVKSYIPEIPWNNSCASALIAFYAHASFTTYGTTGMCNTSPYNTTSSYLAQSAVGASGGPSNCATGDGGTNQSSFLITNPQCQGYAKPSWQSVLGNPADGVRDIPDVSMFAANGVWGHFTVICDSDTANGGVKCLGTSPSTWVGIGGTSVSAPTMAGIQALINQKTGTAWGNPAPMYYSIASTEFGSSLNSCNSSNNPDTSTDGVCSFYDITQGDIDAACENNGSTEKAHCYLPSSTNGALSTDNVTGATVINGGTGYTSAPTCTIAAPSNQQPYKAPTGATLWPGGTQATCTATVSSATTTAVYSVVILSVTAAGEVISVGPQNYTLSGATTTTIATNLKNSINGSSTVATATSSTSTVTITAKTAGYAGNFSVGWGTGTLFGPFYVRITNTSLGQGPNYVNGITIGNNGSGYGPDTPITLGGPGSGAIAVANTTPATGAQSYQPAFGANAGWDFATGIGTPNAYNLVMNPAWH